MLKVNVKPESNEGCRERRSQTSWHLSSQRLQLNMYNLVLVCSTQPASHCHVLDIHCTAITVLGVGLRFHETNLFYKSKLTFILRVS